MERQFVKDTAPEAITISHLWPGNTYWRGCEKISLYTPYTTLVWEFPRPAHVMDTEGQENEYLPSFPTASLMGHKAVPPSSLGLASNTKDIWTVSSKW